MKQSTPNKIINHTGSIRWGYFLLMMFTTLMLCLICSTRTSAHPGSGIVVDKAGNVYFTDTGQGIWKIDIKGKLTYLPSSRFHWMDIDEAGYFAKSPKNFGWFERVTPQSFKPALIICSDFPLVFNRDGNMYFADTRPGSPGIVRRTPGGTETKLVTDNLLQHVNGITSAHDGSLYVTEASDPNTSTIRKITMDGKISTIANYAGKVGGKNLPLETTPAYCRGLAVDSSGIIYVAATGSRSILKITPQGKVTAILEEEGPWTPTSVTISGGEIYILEWHDVAEAELEVRTAWIPRVRKIGRDGNITTLATVSR